MSLRRCASPAAALLRSAASPFAHSHPHTNLQCPYYINRQSIARRLLTTEATQKPRSYGLPPLPSRPSGDEAVTGAGPGLAGKQDTLSMDAPVTEKTTQTAKEEQPKQSNADAATTSTQTAQGSAQPGRSTESAKPKRKLRPRKAAMTLSSTAIEHLRELLEQPEPKLIRVGVRNRGCSGLAYHLEYVDKAGAFDETLEQDGVKVLIDSKALFSIIGSEMDWVEDKLSQRFVFKNPNITEQCGCGESFSVG